MRPSRAGEVKNQVDLFPKIAVPLLVRDVLKPVEVRHRGIVEQNVDPAETPHRKIDQRLTVGWLGEVAGLQGDHRSTVRLNQFNGSFGSRDVHVAPDNGSTLSSERQGGFTPHAPT